MKKHKLKYVTLEDMRAEWSANDISIKLGITPARFYQMMSKTEIASRPIVQWKGKFPKGRPLRLLYPRPFIGGGN